MLSKYRNTYIEVEKSGFQNIFKFVNQESGDPMDRIISKTINGFSDYVKKISPDFVIIHGDRLEALAGAIVGSFIYFLITNNIFEIQPDSDTTKTQFLIAEFIFTFLLVITILFVGTHPKLKDNQFYGAVIGLTVIASQYSIGEISSSVLNPAISLGPSLFNIFNGQGLNISLAFSPYYIFITIIGGVFAAYLFKFYLKEKQ